MTQLKEILSSFFQKGIAKTVLAAHGEVRTYENMLSCH